MDDAVLSDAPSNQIKGDEAQTQATEAEKSGKYKTKLLEEYADHVGGGGFNAWASWTYSF